MALIAARSALFNVVFYAQTMALLVVAAPASLVLSQLACVAIATAWARSSLWLLRVLCRTKVEFRGLEHLPSGPYILAAKHQSFVDTIALLTIVRSPSFIMKRELAYVPLWNLFAWRAGMIFVSRGKRGVALEQIARGARRVLSAGRPVIIAPEGTRSPAGAPPAYKYGVAHLHRELPGTPIVPVAVNSGLYWSRFNPLRYPGTIVLSILAPIEDTLQESAFLQRLSSVIEGECDRLLVEAAGAAERPNFNRVAAERVAFLTGVR